MTSTTVNNGQTVNNLDITNGNFLDVSAGGTANNTTIENGGFLAVEATGGGLLGGIFGPKTGGVAHGVTVNNGGTLELRGSNSSASNIVLNGGSVAIDTTASVTGSLTFGATSGTQSDFVSLDGNDGNFKPTLVGFSASSALADNAVHFSGATLTTTVSKGNTIATLSGNGVSNTFTFGGTEHLMIVPDNGDDSGAEAVIVTTNTTTNFSAFPGTGQVSQTSTAQAQQASVPAQGDTVSALQAGNVSQPAISFLSQPHGATSAGGSPLSFGSATTHNEIATATTAGTQSLSSTAHELTLPQTQGMASAILGALSQPQHHGMQSAVAGVLSNPAGAAGKEALAAPGHGSALGWAFQHITAVAMTPALSHIG